MNEIVLDPVCGKEVDPLRARAVGIFGGVTYYFCSAECKTRFRDPRKAPRESTRDIVTRPARTTGETPIFEAPSPTESAQAQAADEAAPAPVPYARSRPRRSEPDPSVKVDPSPSVQEEVEALKSGAGRAWLVVLALFALAGVVLFFAFHR